MSCREMSIYPVYLSTDGSHQSLGAFLILTEWNGKSGWLRVVNSDVPMDERDILVKFETGRDGAVLSPNTR